MCEELFPAQEERSPCPCNVLNAVAFLNNLQRKCWHKLSVGSSSSSIQEIHDNLLIHEEEEEEEEDDDDDDDDQRVSSDHFVSGKVLFLHQKTIFLHGDFDQPIVVGTN
jgi:hypothetical protein